MLSQTRTINGKIYEQFCYVATNDLAKYFAKLLRKKGYNAVILPGKIGKEKVHYIFMMKK